MQPQTARELMSDYVSGDLDRALAVSLENHLAEDAQTRDEVAGLRQVWADLNALPLADAPPFLHENIAHRLDALIAEEVAQSQSRRMTWDWRTWLKPRTLATVAACVALCVVFLGAQHTRHAALDPLGTLLRGLRPAPAARPALDLARAEWTPQGESGVITLHLRAAATTDGKVQTLHYRLAPQSLLASPEKTGVIASDNDSVILLPLPASVKTDQVVGATLSLELRDADTDAPSITLSIPIAAAP